MSDAPISQKLDCGKLVETKFKINKDKDEYDCGDYSSYTTNLNQQQLLKQQKQMVENYKNSIRNIDEIRKSKAVNVNQIINNAQLGDNRECGLMDTSKFILNEYED
jgi:hypothetical protein